MATRQPIQVGDTLPLVLAFKDGNGDLLYSLSPAPDGKLCLPNGTISTIPMTQLGATPFWQPTTPVTAASAGGYGWWGECADTDVAQTETEVTWFEVGMLGVTSEFDGTAETDIDAILAKVNLIGSNSVTISTAGNVGSGTRLYIIIGDAYLSAQSRQLTFSNLSAPDLTTASAINLYIDDQLTASATATSASSCTVELTSTQTNALQPGIYQYDLRATFATPAIVTVIHRGIAQVELPTPGA